MRLVLQPAISGQNHSGPDLVRFSHEPEIIILNSRMILMINSELKEPAASGIFLNILFVPVEKSFSLDFPLELLSLKYKKRYIDRGKEV